MGLAAELRQEFPDCLPTIDQEKQVLDQLVLQFRLKVAEQIGQVARAEGMGVTAEHQTGETPQQRAGVDSLQGVLADIRFGP